MRPLNGLVCPIPVPFESDGRIAKSALLGYCRYLVDSGVSALLVTVGTSRFNLLTREEMQSVNAIVAEACAGSETVAIASGPGPSSGSTQENLEFARAALEAGAHAMIAVFPERWYGNTHVQAYFQRLADESPLPTLIHAVPMRDGFGGIHDSKATGLELLKPLVDHERIVGIKEENGDRHEYERIVAHCLDRVTMIGAGGAMRRFQKDRPLGSTCYLVGIESIQPKLGLQFFDHMMNGQFDEAEQIAVQHEDPFFRVAIAFGWHRTLKAALSLLDLMPGYEREPFPVFEQSEQRVLSEVMNRCGWTI